jgi:hypothetical protein
VWVSLPVGAAELVVAVPVAAEKAFAVAGLVELLFAVDLLMGYLFVAVVAFFD